MNSITIFTEYINHEAFPMATSEVTHKNDSFPITMYRHLVIDEVESIPEGAITRWLVIFNISSC